MRSNNLIEVGVMTYIGSPSDQYRLQPPLYRVVNLDVGDVWCQLLYKGACGAPPLRPPSSPAWVSALGWRDGLPNTQYIRCDMSYWGTWSPSLLQENWPCGRVRMGY